MTEEGYPSEQELETIEKWPLRDVFELLNFIDDLWQYKIDFRVWDKGILHYELHTGGWSGNEEIIEALKKNRFIDRFCVKWMRGGHWYFEINPAYVGFVMVSEMAKKRGVSRQAIHQQHDMYDWLKVGERNFYIRIK
jgi:hypothetical protein